jgi:hypothetical protein
MFQRNLIALLVLLFGAGTTHADCLLYLWPGSPAGHSASEAASLYMASLQSTIHGTQTLVLGGLICDAHAPGVNCAGSVGWAYNDVFTDTDGTVTNGGIGGPINAGSGAACPASCAGLPSQDILAAISASSFNSGGLICVAGCGYTNSSSSMHIGAGSLGLIGQAVPTGATCSAGDGSIAALSTSNCVETGGNTVCHQAAANVATINNDIVNPRALPPAGQCAGYGDGGLECNAGVGGTTPLVQPPTTAGAVDTPAAVVTATGGSTVDFFTGAQVAASATPVATLNAGSVSGNPAGNPASGPCTPSATGVTPVVTCLGTSGSGTGAGGPGATGCDPTTGSCVDPGVPAIPTNDTVQSSVSTYMAAVQATPIVVAFGNLSAAIPSGTCPAPTLHLLGKDYVMDSGCTLWASVSGILSAVMLIAWTLMGARILMSA